MSKSPQNVGPRAKIKDSGVRGSRLSLSNLPIKYRLPLIMGAILLSIILISIWASYSVVKQSALDVGRERLSSLTQQLANQSQQSIPLLLGQTYTIANDPAIQAFLKSPSVTTRPAALAVLRQISTAREPSSLQVELWNGKPALVLTEPGDSAPEAADLSTEFAQCASDPFKAVGPIRLIKDIVAYTAVAAVKDEAGKPIGYLVRWRRVSPTPNFHKQLSDLLGSHAALYYGNSRGDVFTDLEKIVSKPPESLSSTLEVTHYLHDGNAVMALRRPINGTPWFLVIEFPEQSLLAQAHQFLRRMLLFGSILFVTGMAGALVLTNNITLPLQSLTKAASAIGEGDYSRVVGVRGNDELGKLANAFNLMVIEVRDSQRDLKRKASLFDQTYDAVFLWDWNGPITFWNRGAERVYGFAGVDALGKSPHQLLQTQFPAGVDSVIHALDQIGRWEGELEHTTRDGAKIIVDSRMVLMREPEPAHVIEITRDITERKVAVEALAQSERQYRLLFDDSPLPMWVFDRETLRFLAVNEAASYQYGFTREEFLDMTIKDIRPPEEIPRLLRAALAPEKGMQVSGYWKHRKKDGTIIDVEISAHAIDFGGQAGELVLAHNVTDRIRAQDALRVKNDELVGMTQQLWQASKLATMGELSASIAHELNNPLATVALRVENLLTPLAEDDQRRHSLEIISQEVDRMAGLVDNLLQFSRRGHRQVSTVDLRKEIVNSVEFVHYHLRSRKIEVEYEFADPLPTIHGDRQQLRQLFLNLLTNASDAMPRGGKLIVRAAPGSLNGTDAVAIEFADTGEGIPAENLEKIWEPFFTTKPEGKGTGLGLAICRRIVEESGGTIAIESPSGGGTIVRNLFPATTNGLPAKLP